LFSLQWIDIRQLAPDQAYEAIDGVRVLRDAMWRGLPAVVRRTLAGARREATRDTQNLGQ